MARHYQVTFTAPSDEEASRLGVMAVERRLAACAQVSGPISSVYWWEGKIERAEEWVCTLKTTASLVGTLMEVLRDAHTYEVPEVVAVGIDVGSVEYLEWVDAETAACE